MDTLDDETLTKVLEEVEYMEPVVKDQDEFLRLLPALSQRQLTTAMRTITKELTTNTAFLSKHELELIIAYLLAGVFGETGSDDSKQQFTEMRDLYESLDQ
jgi:hypothetical protein